MIEVEVHQRLHAFLREQGEPYWPHHLTMGRLVARALRLQRSVLIQTGTALTGYHGRYRLSYLLPLLMCPGPVILVAPESIQQRLLMVEVPQLKQWMPTHKPIRTGDRWPGEDFEGLLILSPQSWLSDRLSGQQSFPPGIPTVLDGMDDLESWVVQQLTVSLQASDWAELMLSCPEQAELIRDTRVWLTHEVFQHPANPYECYLLDAAEQTRLTQLYQGLLPQQAFANPEQLDAMVKQLLPENWHRFWQRLQSDRALAWVTLDRGHGQFSLHCGPVEVASVLADVWEQQPVVLIGSALDLDNSAATYRQRIGLKDLTCLKFSPDRHTESVQLYLPEGLPMPNTPQFQWALMREVQSLLSLSTQVQGLTVLLVADMPLKAQLGAILAGEYGSRVQVEKTCLDENGILVTGWEFWRQHQGVLPVPHLLVIATLPIPSLENPLVAGRVAYYKRQRQDWFKLYLLPEMLSELQRAIALVREFQGIVALLDNRVLHRSYGNQVLSALSPVARINYLDASLFDQSDHSNRIT